MTMKALALRWCLRRQGRRCGQVCLQQEEQRIRGDVKIEINETMYQKSAKRSNCARVERAGEMTLFGCERFSRFAEQQPKKC